MKPLPFSWKRSGVIFSLLTVALLGGCPLNHVPNGGRSGPVGVVEMDQNTDPRFFLRNRDGVIGVLKTAGREIRLDGKRVARDIRIRNGAHVATGPASAAILQFSAPAGGDCGLEVLDFRHGRIYGTAKRCGHRVATHQGVMETRGASATYHVGIRGPGETIFTAIGGAASVWRHAEPGFVVEVPGYHQVVLFADGISRPRRVSPEEVAEITNWRKNFWRLREAETAPPRRDPDEDSRIRLLEELKRRRERSRTPERVDPLERRPRLDPQERDVLK